LEQNLLPETFTSSLLRPSLADFSLVDIFYDCKQWYRFARLFCHAYWLPQAMPLQYNPSRKRPRSPVAAMQVQLVFQ
jgi:hypothetical protein